MRWHVAERVLDEVRVVARVTVNDAVHTDDQPKTGFGLRVTIRVRVVIKVTVAVMAWPSSELDLDCMSGGDRGFS